MEKDNKEGAQESVLGCLTGNPPRGTALIPFSADYLIQKRLNSTRWTAALATWIKSPRTL